eukprot:3888987-Pyramimonas_sp.AAC.1
MGLSDDALMRFQDASLQDHSACATGALGSCRLARFGPSARAEEKLLLRGLARCPVHGRSGETEPGQ